MGLIYEEMRVENLVTLSLQAVIMAKIVLSTTAGAGSSRSVELIGTSL
jgi:hypothetical protein